MATNLTLMAAQLVPVTWLQVVPGSLIETLSYNASILIVKFFFFFLYRTSIHLPLRLKMWKSLLLPKQMRNSLRCRKWRMSTVRLCAGCVFDHAHLESEMDGTCMKMLRVYGALSADPCHCRYHHAQSLLPLHFPIHPITCFLYTCRSFLCVLYIPKEIVEYVKKYTCFI